MAPLKGVNVRETSNTSRSHPQLTSMLKCLCLCGAPYEHNAQATPGPSGRALLQPLHKAGVSIPSGDTTAPGPDTVNNHVGLNSSAALNSQGTATVCEEDVTLSCTDGHVLEAKADQPPGLLATLTFGGPPASMASQRLCPLNMEVDNAVTSAVVSLYHYCHSSYAINAPTLASASGNGQVPVQPETYIDLPQISSSPPPLSPIPLGPPVSRRLLPPPPAAGSAGAPSDELPSAATSPSIPKFVLKSRALQIPDVKTQVAKFREAAEASIATVVATAAPTRALLPPSPPLAAPGGQLRPGSSLPLPELPGAAHILHPASEHGLGAAWRLIDHPSASLRLLQPPLQAIYLQDTEDTSLLVQQHTERASLPAHQERPSRHMNGKESSGSLALGGGIPATSPGFDAAAAAVALATASVAAAAAASVVAPISPFVTAAGIGSHGVSGAQQSVSGTLSYGYGNCGLGSGFLDAPNLLADGRSAPYSGHISGTYSPRLASFQDGGAGNVSGGASYAQPSPSPRRSSVGLMVPSRVSVSGAGSVLSLPFETSSLFDVTAPRTGLLPEQTALEMSMQAPALDLWAAAEHVSLTSRIAQGAYGVVYRGLWHGCTCAVKLMLAASTENLSSQLTEVFLCKALSCHPNIVQTFDCNVWRITSDTLQAVRSLCSGSAVASPCANGIRGFGGSAGTGTLPTDSPVPPGAMLLHSAASGWLGPSPSTLLSGAPSAVPSPCSFMGTYGMNALVAASSTNSLDRQPGVLLAPGSTCGLAPEMAASVGTAAAASAVFRQEVPSSAMEVWGTTHGGARGLNPVSSLYQQQRPAVATMTATAEPAAASGAAPEANGGSLGALLDRPAGLAFPPQGEAGEPLPWQDSGDVGIPGGESTVLRAVALPLRPTESTPSQSSASLQVPRTHHQDLPQNEGQEVVDYNSVQRGQAQGPQLTQLPLLIRALGPVLEERHSANLICSGILPNLSPAVSLPPSQPLMANVARISRNASELMAQQLRLSKQLRGSRAGSGLEVITGEESFSGCQQLPTPPRYPRSRSPPPPQRTLPGADLGGVKPGQERQQEMLQQQQPVPNAECAGLQPHSVVQDTLPLVQSVGCESVSDEMRLRRLDCEAAAATGSVPLLPPDPAALAPVRVDATLAPSGPAAVSTGEAAAQSAHVLPGLNRGDIQSGDDGGLGIGAVRAAEFSPLSLGGTGAGTPNPASLSQSTSSTCAANADSSGGAAGLPARFSSSNARHIFLDGRWPSPDASSRSPSPALALSSHASPQPGSAVPAAATAAARASAAGSLGTRAASGGTATIPLSAAQVALNMGMNSGLAATMSVGLCSSPLSSGLLPTSLQPGIVSGTTRQLSDHAFTLPGAGPSGGGGLHGMAGPWPLQTRSAVATGDEGDAAAAMVGARNLAQVLNLLGARDCQLVVVVVMEECDRGSLQQLLSKAAAAAVAAAATRPRAGGTPSNLYVPFSGGGRYPQTAALRALTLTAREVALGIAFLHHHNIIHGDLKPGNVLLKSSRQDQRGFVVKISDFGLSRVLHSNGGSHHHLLATGASASSSTGSGGACAGVQGEGQIMGGALDGTVPYLAPELINNGHRSKASDVWAYGVLLWQLVTGLRPFDGLTQWQIMAAVSAGEQLLHWPLEAHPALVHLGRACLAYNPRDRPSFAQIVRRLQVLEADLRAESGK